MRGEYGMLVEAKTDSIATTALAESAATRKVPDPRLLGLAPLPAH